MGIPVRAIVAIRGERGSYNAIAAARMHHRVDMDHNVILTRAPRPARPALPLYQPSALMKRTVFFVSESTGITAEALGHSLLSQFEGVDFERVYMPFINTELRAKALLESARLDGCSNTRFFFAIALPLSKAILSVIMLYYVVLRWNDYFTALIYVRNEEIKPLQIILRDILLMNQAMQGANSYASSESLRLSELIKYSSIIVSTLPVLILYPFIQKYFEKGVMIGALKG